METEATPLATRLLLGASMAAAIAVGVGLAVTMARHASAPAPIHAPVLAPRPLPAPPVAAVTPAPPPLRLRPLPPTSVAKPHLARPERVVRAAPVSKPAPTCHAGSAADRLVCARPQLQAQERQMRRAYDRALAAGVDRLAVDRGQARWRARRERVTSEDELAELYGRRIAELNDAAARAARQPPH